MLHSCRVPAQGRVGSWLSGMVVAERRERRVIEKDRARTSFTHRTNSRQRKSFEAAGNLASRTHGKQQLVIFAAMQRLFERCARKGGWGANRSAQPRRDAQAAKVQR